MMKKMAERRADEPSAGGPRWSRRSFLMSALAVGLLPGAARASWNSYAAPADAWPQFRGNPLLTGFSASRVGASVRLLWTFDAGDAVESSAAIAGGAVYVGTQKGELVALNLSDGGLRWRYATGDPVGESSPAVARGTVYVGDGGGTVHAVRAADGGRVWAFKTGSEVKSSPVVAGTRVVVGSYDTHLYGLSAAAGRPLWKLKTIGQVHATAAVADGVAYVAGCD